MTTEERLMEMKRKLEALTPKRDRAKIELEMLHKRLKDEHGLKTAKEAETKAARLEIEAKKIDGEVEAQLVQIEETHKDLLEMAG
jgi:hypothetical protein